MKLGQIRKEGAVVAAIFEDADMVRTIPAHTMSDLIHRSDAENIPLPQLADQLATRHREKAQPILPIHPAEVWACGCTYQPSAAFRDAEHGTREGMYAHVFSAERPEIFFKGTARVCVGPGQPIGLRKDSVFTAPEPELALILGRRGRVIGYTLANDVSAWDIEKDNPLYLPQSKVYNACCALGPVIVTPESIGDPYRLEMKCSVSRGPEMRFEGSISTAKLNRKFESMIEYLVRSNSVPTASVLLTGTGIIVPETAALAEGDRVTIDVAGIGRLENSAVLV